MGLALLGPQSLDTLQRLAVQNFVDVPGTVLPPASEAYDALPPPFAPSPTAPLLTLMLPVNDAREVRLTWCLPLPAGRRDEWVVSKPEELWERMIANRAQGGLLPLLRAKGLANSLEAGVEELTRSFALLTISIDLTELGLAKWRAVCAHLFAYLRLLSAVGVPRHLTEETISMAATSFRYREPGEAQGFVSAVSPELANYPPRDWITGPATVTPAAAEGAAKMLAFCADPSVAMITLAAKELEGEATQKEPIYGTRYGTRSIRREVEAWKTSRPPPDLRELQAPREPRAPAPAEPAGHARERGRPEQHAGDARDLPPS